jgi:hypothetical protein
MPSKRETILQALDARLKAALRPLRVDYGRNESVPTRIGARGRVILRDGEPGEPEVTLSPTIWSYQHRAELEVFYQGSDGTRELPLDDILVAISQAIATDRRFSGLCDWCEPEAAQPSDIPVQAGLTFRAVTVGVWLHYDTTDPLQ